MCDKKRNPTPETRRDDSGRWGSWAGLAASSCPARDLGERCKLPRGVWGKPRPQEGSRAFRVSGWPLQAV